LEKDLAQPPECPVMPQPEDEKSFSRRSLSAGKQLTNSSIFTSYSPCKIIYQGLQKNFDGTEWNLGGTPVAKHFTC
jgi:hypothetical protein